MRGLSQPMKGSLIEQAQGDGAKEVWEIKVPTSLLKDGRLDGLGLGSSIILKDGDMERFGGKAGVLRFRYKPVAGPKFLVSKTSGGAVTATKVSKTLTITVPPVVDLSKGVKGQVKGGYGQVKQVENLQRRWRPIGDVGGGEKGTLAKKATKKEEEASPALPKASKKRKQHDDEGKKAKKAKKGKKSKQ